MRIYSGLTKDLLLDLLGIKFQLIKIWLAWKNELPSLPGYKTFSFRLATIGRCVDVIVPFKHETTEFSVLEIIFVSYFELSSRDRLILYLLLFDERIPSCFTYS